MDHGSQNSVLRLQQAPCHGLGGQRQAHGGSQQEEEEGSPSKSWKYQQLLGVLPTRQSGRRGQTQLSRPGSEASPEGSRLEQETSDMP